MPRWWNPRHRGCHTARLPTLPPGTLEISLAGPEVERLLADDKQVMEKTLELKVEPHPDLEMLDPNADPRFLADITAAGRGTVLDGSEASAPTTCRTPRPNTRSRCKPASSPTPKTRRRAPPTGFPAVFISLITAEWVLRKVGGLV